MIDVKSHTNLSKRQIKNQPLSQNSLITDLLYWDYLKQLCYCSIVELSLQKIELALKGIYKQPSSLSFVRIKSETSSKSLYPKMYTCWLLLMYRWRTKTISLHKTFRVTKKKSFQTQMKKVDRRHANRLVAWENLWKRLSDHLGKAQKRLMIRGHSKERLKIWIFRKWN